MDEPFEIEARGATEGINPMFGEWSQKFDLEKDQRGQARIKFSPIRLELSE